MKRFIFCFCLLGSCGNGFGQGLVNFFNNATTLISTGFSTGTAISGTPGSYYFALLIAPAGTTDRSQFMFTGAYGTNQAVAGRFSGGGNVMIPGWQGGTTRAFMVAGWAATLGHDWNPSWLTMPPLGEIGFSSIAQGVAGGFDGTATLPNLNIFGLNSINMGFTLFPGCLGPYWMGFTFHPTNQTVVVGGTALFTVGAIACPGPRYQWFFNGVPIAGANAGYYRITNVQPQHAGSYYAILSGHWWPCCPTVEVSYPSFSAYLTVLVPPSIISQPQPRTAEQGSETRFSIHAMGDPSPTYRWFFNGNIPLTGATTNSSLQLTNVQFAQAGAYTVVVSNAAGAVVSAPAALSVIPIVPTRMVPGLLLAAEPASLLNIDYTPQLEPPDWQSFPAVYFTNSPQFYFDLSSPLPAKRFYRVWQAGAPATVPSVSLPGMVPALTLAGAIGSRVKVEGINQIGPTNAWFTLDTVTLSETPQLYFDTSAVGQPTRLYRLSPVP